MNNPQSQRRFYSDIRHTVSSAIKSENSYHPVESYGSAVEDLLKTHIKEKCSTAIDLGSYTGKWLPHLGKYAQKIICADLIDNNFSMIQERFKEEKFDSTHNLAIVSVEKIPILEDLNCATCPSATLKCIVLPL